MKKFIALLLLSAQLAQAAYETGPANTVLRVPGAGGRPRYGAVDLAQSAATANQLPVPKGGTGVGSLTSNGVVLGNGSSAVTVTAAPGAFQTLRATSAGSPVFTNVDSPYLAENYSCRTTVSGAALTVQLFTADGNTPTSANSPRFGFRSATATGDTYNMYAVTSALSLTVPQTATLGMMAATQQYLYVYALSNGGTVELAIAGSQVFDLDSLQTTTVLNTSSNSGTVMYSTVARTTVPVRLLCRIQITEGTAGNWTTAPTEIAVGPHAGPKPETLSVQTTSGSANSAGSWILSGLVIPGLTPGRWLFNLAAQASASATTTTTGFGITDAFAAFSTSATPGTALLNAWLVGSAANVTTNLSVVNDLNMSGSYAMIISTATPIYVHFRAFAFFHAGPETSDGSVLCNGAFPCTLQAIRLDHL